MTAMETQLQGLETMSPAELRSAWRQLYMASAPLGYTADLLIRGIAWRMQAKVCGGLPLATQRELARLSRTGEGRGAKPGTSAPLKPGSRLIRRWRGTTYVVEVTDGGFVFEDRSFASLSAIACAITGTQWSGPRFFGLGRADK